MSGVGKVDETIYPLEWPIERAQWQNPRIRALLGCVRSLDGVMESNFAILHCSPTRLLEIWDTVRQVCHLLRTEVTRLMEEPSALPDLDEAVQHAREKLRFLDSEIFVHIDHFPERPQDHEHDALRRTLCVTIGKLHGFLLDTLGEILAADPRSHHDIDYFLARKFPRDVEEAEWLQTSVHRLDVELKRINVDRHTNLGSVIDDLGRSGRLPPAESWQRLSAYLDELENEFAPKLMGIVGLHGIRFDELEVLQSHAGDLPESCRLVRELYETAGVIIGKLIASLDASDDEAIRESVVHAVEQALCNRIGTCLRGVENELRDLAAFIPLWLKSVEQRRALMLRLKSDAVED
jgi:FtsZ-binding cell division protein ZapB